MTAMQMLSPINNVFVVADNPLGELEGYPFGFHIKADSHILERLKQENDTMLIFEPKIYATIFKETEIFREDLLRMGLREIDKESEEGMNFFIEFSKIFSSYLQTRSMDVAQFLRRII